MSNRNALIAAAVLAQTAGQGMAMDFGSEPGFDNPVSDSHTSKYRDTKAKDVVKRRKKNKAARQARKKNRK